MASTPPGIDSCGLNGTCASGPLAAATTAASGPCGVGATGEPAVGGDFLSGQNVGTAGGGGPPTA